MKIFIINDSSQKLGGGFRFIENFKKGVTQTNFKATFVDNIADCDIFFIPSVTMCLPESFNKAKDLKKRIVVRLDNIPKKSKNPRSRIYDRMPAYCQGADLLIYQSSWAYDYVSYFVCRQGESILHIPSEIINNGVDKSIFNIKGNKRGGTQKLLHAQFNTDETKQPHKSFYYFHEFYRADHEAELHLVGQYPSEQIQHNFDFFCNETVKYHGVINTPEEMANIYKQCDYFLYPYFNDACSNTLLEAMACGCKIVWLEKSGCAKELKALIAPPSIKQMAQRYLRAINLIL